MRFFITKKNLVWLIFLLCCVIFAIFLTGCGASVARDAISIPVKGAVEKLNPEADTAKTKEQDAVDAASDKVAVLTGDLAKAKAELDQKEDALRKARYASLRTLAFWLAGIAFLATCGAVAAAFFLPVFRKQLLIGAVACVGVIVLCLSFEAMLDYIPWIGGAMVSALIGWLIFALIKSRKAITLTAEAGDLFANAVTTDEITKVKESITASQIKAGVRNLIQDARGKLA